MNLLVLSDIHAGGSDDEFEALAEIVDYILAAYDPTRTAVAMSGDLTDHTAPDEIAAVKVKIDRLEAAGFLVFRVPGNHDWGRHGNLREEERAHHWRSELHPGGYPFEWHWRGWHILGLDSCAGGGQASLARGTLGSEQLGWLHDRLQRRVPTVVLVHHHLYWINPFLTLTDADQAQALLRRSNCSPVVVIFGHRHTEAVWRGRDGCDLVLSSGKCTRWRQEPKKGWGRLAFWRRRPRWLQFWEVSLGDGVEARKVVLE